MDGAKRDVLTVPSDTGSHVWPPLVPNLPIGNALVGESPIRELLSTDQTGGEIFGGFAAIRGFRNRVSGTLAFPIGRLGTRT